MFAQCEKDKPGIAAPSLRHAGGNECWEWIVAPREEDKPPIYAPPALTQALDFLDTVWRLRFGKTEALLKLPSATSIANLSEIADRGGVPRTGNSVGGCSGCS